MTTREDRMWALARSVGRVLTELGRELILAAQEAEAERLATPAVGERELVVRWLNQQGRTAPGVKADTLFAAADAIKQGHHINADEAWAQQGSEQGAMGPAAVPTGWVEKGPKDDLLDEPDLAQAPTNLGHGPVPLFLDGEDEDLDGETVEEEAERECDPLELSGQEAVAREKARGLKPEDPARKAERVALDKWWAGMGFVAPEQWGLEDAQKAGRYFELKGEPVPGPVQELVDKLLGEAPLLDTTKPHTLVIPAGFLQVGDVVMVKGDLPGGVRSVEVRQATDEEQHAALEAEAKRLNEQERRGG